VAGFVDPECWLRPDGVELLTPAGTLQLIPHSETKLVCFVKDFDGTPLALERRRFHTRPKIEGLWIRAQLLDNDFQDGVLPNDLTQLDRFGFLVSPPDPAANSQKIFIPRPAIKDFRVLAVVGGASKRKKEETAEEQIGLFDN